MNTKHISLAFAAVAALLAGCAKSPIETPSDTNGLTDLELAYVGATETKAAIDGTTFPQTGEIGLFLFKEETATQDYGDGYKNIKYTYNSSISKWTASPSIKVGSTPGYLYGYYPYKADTQGQPIDVKAIPVSSSVNGDDVMYASRQDVITDAMAANTAITMNHALARVSITVINKGYTGKAELSQIKFEGAKIAPTGTLNALNGSITATKTDEVTLDVTGDAQTITAAGTTYECLLVPSGNETGKQSVDLTLTIDDDDKKAQLTGGNGVIFAQGTRSNITITLSNTGIFVQTVSVENWNVVEVGEYKVTVKLDADVSDIKKDVWLMAYNDGNAVKIEAYSKSGHSLGCYRNDNVACATAKSDNIYTFTISGISSDITATVDYQRPTGLTLSKSSLTVDAGCSFRLSATVSPDDAYNKACTWSSNNPDIATVDENGKVMTKTAETVVITATTVKGGVTANCTLTVNSYEPLPKEFSVGPAGNCKKVRFSRGNLKYTPDIDSWWFFDKQYDSGHGENQLSLFTWGYGDWSTVWNTTSYGSESFTDWGTQVGDGKIWRTLSSEEWTYLLEGRIGAADKVGFATVCEIKGIIVLPDEFVDPKTNESTSDACVDKKFVPKASTDWNQNVYSAGDNWDKMEAAGALFLPAAGYRQGTNILGIVGHYWSSTGSVPENAKRVNFTNGGLWLNADDKRSNGYSVRLVTEVK